MHNLRWQPGQHGKGYIDGDGSVVTWVTDGPWGSPHHSEKLLGYLGDESTVMMHRDMAAFVIDPDGEVQFAPLGNPDDPRHQLVFDADPRLVPSGSREFHFASEQHPNARWERERYGKGFYLHDGSIHSWNTEGDDNDPDSYGEDDGEPTHYDYATRHLGVPEGHGPAHEKAYDAAIKTAFWMTPDGEWQHSHDPSEPWHPQFVAAIKEAHPDMLFDDDWHFARVTNNNVDVFDWDQPDHVPVNSFGFESDHRPVAYFQDPDEVYIGPHGSHHMDIANESGRGFGDAASFGSIWNDRLDWGMYGGGHQISPPPPHVDEAVKDHLREHHGIEQDDDDEFKFGADHSVDDLVKQFTSLIPPDRTEPPKPDPKAQRQRWRDAFDNAADRDSITRWGDSIGWMPIEEAMKYREYDRDIHPDEKDGGYTKDLYDSIAKHGIGEPLILEYNHEKGDAHFGEGNHRLAIAEMLGHTHVPVLGYDSRRVPSDPTSRPATPVPQRLAEGHGGYIPQYFNPGHLGIPVRDNLPPYESRTQPIIPNGKTSNASAFAVELKLWLNQIDEHNRAKTGPTPYHDHEDQTQPGFFARVKQAFKPKKPKPEPRTPEEAAKLQQEEWGDRMDGWGTPVEFPFEEEPWRWHASETPRVVWHGPHDDGRYMQGDHSFIYVPEGESGGPAVHIGTPTYHHADIAGEGIHPHIDGIGWDEDRFPTGSVYDQNINMDSQNVDQATHNSIAKALGLPVDAWRFGQVKIDEFKPPRIRQQHN